MNRVLCYLNSEWRTRRAQQDLDRITAEAERVELAAGDALEFHVPSLARYMDPGDDDEEFGLRFYILLEPRRANAGEALGRYAIEELRRIGAGLLDAADKIEHGGTRATEAVAT